MADDNLSRFAVSFMIGGMRFTYPQSFGAHYFCVKAGRDEEQSRSIMYGAGIYTQAVKGHSEATMEVSFVPPNTKDRSRVNFDVIWTGPQFTFSRDLSVPDMAEMADPGLFSRIAWYGFEADWAEYDKFSFEECRHILSPVYPTRTPQGTELIHRLAKKANNETKKKPADRKSRMDLYDPDMDPYPPVWTPAPPRGTARGAYYVGPAEEEARLVWTPVFDRQGNIVSVRSGRVPPEPR